MSNIRKQFLTLENKDQIPLWHPIYYIFSMKWKMRKSSNVKRDNRFQKIQYFAECFINNKALPACQKCKHNREVPREKHFCYKMYDHITVGRSRYLKILR